MFRIDSVDFRPWGGGCGRRQRRRTFHFITSAQGGRGGPFQQSAGVSIAASLLRSMEYDSKEGGGLVVRVNGPTFVFRCGWHVGRALSNVPV